MRACLSALVLLCASSWAAAQDATQAKDTHWYFGASLGQSRIRIPDAFLDPGLPTTGSSLARDETGTAYKLLVGYRLSRHFAVEGGYLNLGSFSARRSWNSITFDPGAPTAGPGTIGWQF